MATFTGSIVSAQGNLIYIDIITPSVATGTFGIVSDVTTQTGNNSPKTSDIFEPIRATSLTFKIRDFLTSAGTSFYESELKGASSDEIEIGMREEGGNYFFNGFVIPKSIELNLYYDFSEITIIASDGLSLLKQIPFDLSGNYTLSEAVRTILNETGLTYVTNAVMLTNWQDTAMTSANPSLIRFDVGLLVKGKRNATYWDALTVLLRRFGYVISQELDQSITVRWLIVKRDIMGNNTTVYSIALSTGTVTTLAYDDSETITTAMISKDHYQGQLNAVQKVLTNFEWDNTNPPVQNTNFQTWNVANTIPTSWNVESGAFSKQTNANGNIVARTSNDGILSQVIRIIKPAFQSFTISVRLDVLVNALAPDEGTLTYEAVQVKFIDPTGAVGDYYLNTSGGVTTTATWLTYNQEISIANRGLVFDRGLVYSLTESGIVWTNNRIVEVRLWGNREDTLATGNFLDYVQFKSCIINNFETSIPDFRETAITESFAGDVIENTFSLSDQTIYNGIGAIEVYNGASWVVGTNWGSGYTFDETYTRMINSQTKANLLYLKFRFTPEYFLNRVFTDVITFNSVEYVPVFFLRNWSRAYIDVQAIELRTDTPSAPTETFLIEA